MALGIDRYLVSLGKRQLFASQAHQSTLGACWCLDPVEKKFPADRRYEFMQWNLEDAIHWVASLNSDKACPLASECEKNRDSSPEGSIPGFW